MAGVDTPFDFPDQESCFSVDTSKLSISEARDFILDLIFIGEGFIAEEKV
jgi:hypothetical protein